MTSTIVIYRIATAGGDWVRSHASGQRAVGSQTAFASAEWRHARLRALVECYRDELYAFSLRMTRSEADALEIVQESFLSAYRRLNEFPTEAEFCAWIHTNAASHALDSASLPSSHSLLDRAVVQNLAIDRVDDAKGRPLSPELRRAIEETTESLPRFQREVFLLKDVAGLDYDQIAAITGKPVASIKTHLHQARLTLRDTIVSLPV